MEKLRKYKLEILITVLSISMLSLCFNRSLWGDEAWTTLLLKNDFKTMIQIIRSDVHPPLYFIILKIVTLIFGDNIIILKILSVLPMIILMIVSKYYIKKFFNNDIITIVFMLLIGLSPSCLHMSVELRMYSWSILFVTWNGFIGYDIFLNNQTKDKILFIISGLLAAYTHNFNIIAEIFVYGILFLAIFIKKDKAIKDILFISCTTIIGYLPWLLISFDQLNKVNADFWLWPLNFYDIAQMIIYPFNSLCHNSVPPLGILIFIGSALLVTLLLGVWLFYQVIMKRNSDQKLVSALLCYIPMYGVVCVGILYGLLIKPVFVARYMHATIGIFFLGVAIAVAYLKKRELRIFIILVIVSNLCYGYVFNFQREYLNGTEDTLTFLEEFKNKSNCRTIVTDIFLLSTTTLNYYEPDCIVYSDKNYDIYNCKDQILYLADSKEEKINLDKLTQNGIKYEKIYSGDIDFEYFFDIYLIN